MNFGISFLPDADGKSLSALDYFTNAIKIAKMADEAGMNTIKITEHYLHPYGGFCSSPMLFLASVAAVTKKIRLMTGCILPVFHHPIQIASHTAMLDVLSQGRLDVGFARAYLPYEFSAFGIAMDGSRERYTKTIETTIELWKKSNVCADNEFFKFDNATIYPETMQKPHPPVWGAAVMSRQSLSWLGEKGFNLLVTPPIDGMQSLKEKISIYLDSYAKQAHAEKPKITLSMPLLIATSEKTALNLAERYLQNYLTVWGDACGAWSQQQSRDYPGYQFLKDVIKRNTPLNMINSLQALVGTPEKIIGAVHEILQHVPCTEIIWQVDFGAQPSDVSLNTVELFIQEVMSNFRNKYAI